MSIVGNTWIVVALNSVYYQNFYDDVRQTYINNFTILQGNDSGLQQ